MNTEKNVPFEAVDLQSRKIIEFIAALSIELPLQLFLKEKSKQEQFEAKLNELVRTMLESNGYLREFRISSKKAEKEFKEKIRSVKERKTQDITEDTTTLFDEYAKYLKSVQSVLDHLAELLDISIGSDFKSWKIEQTEAGKVSGSEVLKYLKALSKEDQDKSVGMAEVVETSMGSLSYIAELQAISPYPGEGVSTTPLRYDHIRRVVVPVGINHPDAQFQTLLEFMDNTMSYLINFVVGVTLRALSFNEPGYIILRSEDRRGVIAYRAIPVELLKNSMRGQQSHDHHDHSGHDHSH